MINSREERWWRFLSTSDEYDPERLNFDKELLRRFYLKNGYVDFEVKAAKSELAPDRSGLLPDIHDQRGRALPGRQGHHQLAAPQPQRRRSARRPQINEGDWYDGDAVGRTVEAIELEVHTRGYAFVEVKPRINRDPEKHTVDLIVR